jgi:hypothetical protein
MTRSQSGALQNILANAALALRDALCCGAAIQRDEGQV